MIAQLLNIVPLLKKAHRFLISNALLKERDKEIKHLRSRLRKMEKLYKQATEQNVHKR